MVFGTLLIVILGIILLIWQPWNAKGAEPTATPSTTTTGPATSQTTEPAPTDPPAEGEASAEPEETDPPVEEEKAEPEPAPTEQGIVQCGPNDIKVEASTDKGEYTAEELPQLTLALTNTSNVDCTIDVGTAVQTFTITSGSDTWWRSTDCQANPANQLVTLAAGQTATSQTPLVWDRTRSSVDSCADENRPRAAGGGASYHLAVSLAGVESEGTAQFLLY